MTAHQPHADASVRPARPTDAPAIGQVQAQVFIDTYADRLPPEVSAGFAPAAFASVWRRSLESPREGINQLLVALAGQQVVGLVAVGPSQDPDTGQATGEVTLLAVHPLARNQGHGSRLLNAAIDVLREAGAEAVALWVLADDEATRRFLQQSGLHPDGAYRDRVVGPEDQVLREVRLSAGLGAEEA